MPTAVGKDADLARLEPALNLKHGYETMEKFRKGAQKKFSLLETGVIQKPSTRILLINVSLESLIFEQ